MRTLILTVQEREPTASADTADIASRLAAEAVAALRAGNGFKAQSEIYSGGRVALAATVTVEDTTEKA